MKGGPGLHPEDKRLLEGKVLEPADLVCFRKGEYAFDQAGQRLAPLEKELVKIRGKKGSWECRFYDPALKGCRIYGHRPLQCRVLMCWNTRPIEELMRSGERLTRLELVPEGSALAGLIMEHETRCALSTVGSIVREDGMDAVGARQKILDMCSYDLSFRDALREKTGVLENVLECYFGRPLFRAVLGYAPWFASSDFLGYFVDR